MKKFIFTMSLLFTLCSFTYAQTAYEKSKILDNTSINVVGGATTPLDFNSVFPVNGVAGIKLQKDLTPVFGFNVEGLASFGDNHYGSVSTVVKSINTGLNGVINFSNLLCGYNGTPRKFEVSTETGIGWLHSWTGHSNYLTSKTGAILSFNLGKEKAHSVIINPAVYWNLSKTGKIQFNKNHAQLGLLIGYVYHFKTSNGTHSFKAYDIGAMNDEINNLKAELAKKPTEIVKEVVKTKVVTNTIGNTVVFFAQNSSELTGTAMAELSKIPSGSKVSIIGSASPEGSSKYNQKLSEKRAETVSKFLTGNGVIVENCTGIGVTDTTSGRVATVTIK